MHYFVNGRAEEARELWKKHLINIPRLMFQWVCQVARRTASPELAADLFALLTTSPSTTPGARGNALSCLLDVLSKFPLLMSTATPFFLLISQVALAT